MYKYQLLTGCNKDKVISNAYIEMKVLHDFSTLYEFDEDMFVGSTTGKEIDEFIDLLCDFELSSRNYEHLQHRYGVLFTFMLDKRYEQAQLKELCRYIAERFNDLPYFAWSQEQGAGHYLVMYVCERHFDENGILTTVVASNDRYRSSKTGKVCKSDDPDAVCFIHKGDKISESYSFFGKKETFFKFSTQNKFISFIAALKDFFCGLLNKLLDVPYYTGVTFKRFVKKTCPKSMLTNAKIFNETFKQLDDIFNKFYQGCLVLGYINDKNVRTRIDLLFNKYLNFIKEGSFSIQLRNRKLKIRIDLMDDYAHAKASSFNLIDKLQGDIKVMMNEFLTQTDI